MTTSSTRPGKTTATEVVDDQQWLQHSFGCRMQDATLLRQALSHRSVGDRNNERLEFLGDAVLDFVISEALYHQFPEADEGELSRLRVALVKGATLADLARELSLGERVRLGAGERSGGGRQRRSILADTLEAVIGALALDQGLSTCREAVLRIFQGRLQGLDLSRAEKDPKTRLQEWLQGAGRPLPAYELRETRGDDHDRHFTVSCSVSEPAASAEGEGRSLRAAEQAAAAALLARLLPS